MATRELGGGPGGLGGQLALQRMYTVRSEVREGGWEEEAFKLGLSDKKTILFLLGVGGGET